MANNRLAASSMAATAVGDFAISLKPGGISVTMSFGVGASSMVAYNAAWQWWRPGRSWGLSSSYLRQQFTGGAFGDLNGWRSAFSTLARDNGFARDVVELALDHIHDNEVSRAYDRGERFTQRIELFDWWGKQLMAAQRGAQIIPV